VTSTIPGMDRDHVAETYEQFAATRVPLLRNLGIGD
jgi:hypothetical protein